MTYLFLGNQADVKSHKINQITSQYIKSNEARSFDYVSLYADKLDKDELKKALIDLPAVAKKRVIVLRLIEKLKKDHQRIIEEFLNDKTETSVLILESERADLKNAFINKLKRIARVEICDSNDQTNVFDMTRDIERNNNVGALKTLAQLIDHGEAPVRILGALIWFWGKMKAKVSRTTFQQGLQCLQEADLNIKRSRLDPVYSLEKLVVSLSLLLS